MMEYRRRMNLFAKAIPTGGGKEVLVNRIKDEDIHFVQTHSLSMNDENLALVKTVLDGRTYGPDHSLADDTGGKRITPRLLGCLRPGVPISADIIEVCCSLFQQFDTGNCSAYRDVNSSWKFYTERKLSDFRFIVTDVAINGGARQFVEDVGLSLDRCRVYIFAEGPGRYDDSKSWTLFIIDIAASKLHWFHPHFDGSVDVPANATAYISSVTNFLSECIQLILPQPLIWPCTMYLVPGLERERGFELLENDFDSGMYVITACHYFLRDVPLVFIQDDMGLFRLKLCYDILRSCFDSVALT